MYAFRADKVLIRASFLAAVELPSTAGFERIDNIEPCRLLDVGGSSSNATSAPRFLAAAAIERVIRLTGFG